MNALKSPWLIASWVFVLLTFAASFYVWTERTALLPDKVPVHWGIDGKPDGWQLRDDMFWWLMAPPLGMVAFGLLTLAIPWLSPKPFAIDGASATYQYVMFLVIALFGLMIGVILMGYCDPQFQVAKWMVVNISLFFMLLGNVLGRVPRNFFIGVRTPWTLANNKVWVMTHRLTAWLFVADGFTCAVLGLIGAPFVLIFIVLIGPALIPVFYSLWLYKKLEREGKLEAA